MFDAWRCGESIDMIFNLSDDVLHRNDMYDSSGVEWIEEVCTDKNYAFGAAIYRWEDGLAERVEYDSDGNVKTQVVKSPFVQVH